MHRTKCVYLFYALFYAIVDGFAQSPPLLPRSPSFGDLLDDTFDAISSKIILNAVSVMCEYMTRVLQYAITAFNATHTLYIISVKYVE